MVSGGAGPTWHKTPPSINPRRVAQTGMFFLVRRNGFCVFLREMEEDFLFLSQSATTRRNLLILLEVWGILWLVGLELDVVEIIDPTCDHRSGR
jgi:hypothetical protein